MAIVAATGVRRPVDAAGTGGGGGTGGAIIGFRGGRGFESGRRDSGRRDRRRDSGFRRPARASKRSTVIAGGGAPWRGFQTGYRCRRRQRTVGIISAAAAPLRTSSAALNSIRRLDSGRPAPSRGRG